MRQNAWLDYAYGLWHLVTENEDDPVRYWRDKGAALAELSLERWTLANTFPWKRRCDRNGRSD